MIKRLFFAAAMMLTVVSGTAGTITNGTWSPSGCGIEPVVPVIDQSSVEAYNQSVKAINDWQQKANAYNGCLIKEANADNSLIANSANDEQARLRAAIEKIQAETTAAKGLSVNNCYALACNVQLNHLVIANNLLHLFLDKP